MTEFEVKGIERTVDRTERRAGFQTPERLCLQELLLPARLLCNLVRYFRMNSGEAHSNPAPIP